MIQSFVRLYFHFIHLFNNLNLKQENVTYVPEDVESLALVYKN